MTTRKEQTIPFVNLHGHTTFSIFDGMGYPKDHMDFAYENGSDALAITDHGNMNALSYQVIHAKKMKAEGKKFKPIFGIEAYFIDDIDKWKKEYEESTEKKKKKDFGLSFEDEAESKRETRNLLNRRAHLVLLAQNQKGLENLFELVSKSYERENFYRYPRMDYKMLEEHNEGVICSSACLSGPLSKDYWNNRELGAKAIKVAMRATCERFKGIFGDRFYGELQWNGIPEQHDVNSYVIEVCEELGIELVSTADAHYPRPELFKDRELYKQIGWLGKTKPDYMNSKLPQTREDLKYELYPKNGDEMYAAFLKYSDNCDRSYDSDLVRSSITRTHDIAHNKIEDFYPNDEVNLPSWVAGKKSDVETLRNLCFEGLKNKNLDNKEYNERLEKELEVIETRGFAKYFLTMKAISDKAQEVQLVGPGRGSAAGSLISYVLEITQIDPIKHGLLFERFLTRDGKGYPDIDYDVADPMALKDLFIEEWGKKNVVPISNFNTLQFRSLIKDVSKFYDIPFMEVNNITNKMMDEATPLAKQKHNIKAGVYTPTFEELCEFSHSLKGFFNKYPQIKDHVLNLIGQVRSISRHAGGVLIADDLNKKMPLINSGGVVQTPWTEGQNVRHLEPFGFIKFDILGLASLRMIEGAIRHILVRHEGIAEPTFEDVRQFYDKHLHPDVMNLDDAKIYRNIFQKGKWAGIFQFTNNGAQTFCKEAKPKNLIDLSAITSIFRPGPLSANVHNMYVAAKNNPTGIKYLTKEVKEITKDTYGFLIFQEQIALLAHRLGKDLSLDEGNMLRKVLTKKGTGKEAKVKKKLHSKFIAGCVEKKIERASAEKLWQTFEYFSGYGFNKSHAVSYSALSFQCAWLFHNYPAEWMAAFLDKEPEDRKAKAISIARTLGFKTELPSINTSANVWEISDDGKTLYQPLTSLKGLGDKAIEQIMSHRPFNTIEEFLFHKEISYGKLNKKSIDVLVRSHALNELIDDRFTGMKHFWSSVAVDRPRNQKKLDENIETYADEKDFTNEEKIQYLDALTGVYPVHMVVDQGLLTRFEKMKVPPLGEYDKALKIAWFIPKEVVSRKTKNGKVYWLVKVTDSSSKIISIKCWGVNPDKDKVELNKPYFGKLDYSEKWGFSTRSLYHNFKLL